MNKSRNNSLQDILNAYIERGFGSMTKNDFEVWIFHQLLCGDLHNKTNREISTALRIPDSKVKRLRYEADLKWGNPNDDGAYVEALKNVILKARLVKERTQILLVIEDTALLKYLDAKMKSAKVSWDKSFNSENIYIDFEQYETFCKEVLTTEYEETIKFLNENNFKDEHPLVKFFKELRCKSKEQLFEELTGGVISAAKSSVPLLLSMI